MPDETSIQESILQAIQSTIQALGLADLNSQNVVIHSVPRAIPKDLPSPPYPAVILGPLPENFAAEGGTNLRDVTSYNIGLYLLDQTNGNQQAGRNRLLLWRESIKKAFHNKRLSGIATCERCTVRPLDVFNASQWTRGISLSGLVVQVDSREARD